MEKQAAQARIDRAHGTLRRALVEMAKAGVARHGEGSASERAAGKSAEPAGRGTKDGQSVPSGQ